MYSTNIFFITVLRLLVRKEKYTAFNRYLGKLETEGLNSRMLNATGGL